MIEKVSADTRIGEHETPLSFSLASVASIAERAIPRLTSRRKRHPLR